MERLLTCILLILPIFLSAQSRPLKGRVVDKNHQPIEYAAVMMQTLDSVFVCSTTTDSLGNFSLSESRASFRLYVQQLMYQPFIHQYTDKDNLFIVLEERDNILKEVVVKANRPIVKVENGMMNYDLSVLTDKKVVSNVYEALKELPGIREDKGELTLAGAPGLSVILNGKPSTMTYDQLKTLLQNMPVNRVEKVEVTYSAPPQYHIRGAAINVVLNRASDFSFQGEITAMYLNKFFNSYGTGANLRFSTPKYALDVMYDANNDKDFQRVRTLSLHTLGDTIYNINQDQQIRSKGWTHSLRSALEYNISDKSTFDIAYVGDFSPRGSQNVATTGNYQESASYNSGTISMNNVSTQYKSSFGLSVGVDYTNYHTSGVQQLNSTTNKRNYAFMVASGQNIDRLLLTADQEHPLKSNWNLGYGVSYCYANDKNYQTYSKVQGGLNTKDTKTRLEEQTTDFYFKMGKDYESGQSFSISATGEYYSIGSYHKWAIFPQASLTYFKSPENVFQLSLSTKKQYPNYWEMNPSLSYIDVYAVAEGTPGLRPASTCSVTGSYILNQRYTFTLFWTYINDYFTQSVYQSTKQLQLIYKTRNWNYSQRLGANVAIPFKMKGWLDSQLSLTVLNSRQKCDDYYDIPFNRSLWMGDMSLNNNIILNKQISFELNASGQTKSMQGTYDVNGVYSVDAAAKWTFDKGRATLSARLNDIFDTGMPFVKVRFKGQYLNMNMEHYNRNVELHFSYRFGGYKEKEMKEVDTSRFGKK